MSTTVTEPPTSAAIPASLANGAVLLDRTKTTNPDLEPTPAAEPVEPDTPADDVDQVATDEPDPEPSADPEPAPPQASKPKRDPNELGWIARTAKQIGDVRDEQRQRKNDRLRDRANIIDQASPDTAKRIKAGSYWFKRNMVHAAYWMSIAMSGYGQTSFFAGWLGLGNGPLDLARAALGAVFLEMVMVGANGYAMYHRTHHPESGWLPIRIFAYLVCVGGAALNYAHFVNEPGMAAMFAGATLAGFILQDITGHLKVRVLLMQERRMPERQKIGALRWVIYRSDAYQVWKSLVADPDLKVDDEFRRVLLRKQGKPVDDETAEPTATAEPAEQGTPHESAPTPEPEPEPAPKPVESKTTVPDETDTEKTVPTLRAIGSNRAPRSTGTRSKSSKGKNSGRTSRSEYLQLAREHFADKPDSAISVANVANAVGCAQSTASGIARDLKAERGIA